MQVLIVLSVGVSIITILSACFILRRVKKQIMEMTEALHDVKEGNGNRRILSAANELVAPLAYEMNEIIVSYENRLSKVRQGRNVLSFLLRFYVYLRTEVVSAHLLKSMLFESRCWRLFFTLRKYINGVLGYAKRFVNFLGMYRRKRYGILRVSQDQYQRTAFG